MQYEYVCKCNCGAVTVTVEGQDYSMPRKLFNQLFDGKGKKIFHRNCNCNYCVNHWGIDLCACGSGENFHDCKEGYDECGQPMQDIREGQTSQKGEGSWV